MRIFVSYSPDDFKLVAQLRDKLIEFGHDIFVAGKDVKAGQVWDIEINKHLENADIFIPIFTINSIKYNWVTYEYGVFLGYVRQNKNKTIIPVVIDDVNLPSIFSSFQFIRGDKNYVHELTKRIQETISQYEGRKIAEKEKAEKRRKTIEKSSADFIADTITVLETKEKEFKTKANTWYILGYIALLLGVGIASYITIKGIGIQGEWTGIMLLAVKAGFVILLLLSASKYSFNLAKTYMNESLKNSDRIHAISFGKFYLQIFGNDIDKTDVKEVFREWNLEQKSSFTYLKSDDYDPKLIDKIAKLVKLLKK